MLFTPGGVTVDDDVAGAVAGVGEAYAIASAIGESVASATGTMKMAGEAASGHGAPLEGLYEIVLGGRAQLQVTPAVTR